MYFSNAFWQALLCGEQGEGEGCWFELGTGGTGGTGETPHWETNCREGVASGTAAAPTKYCPDHQN